MSEPLRSDLLAKAERYGAQLRRCDAMAPAPVRADQAFRRLIDGALANLAMVPDAVEAQDHDLLARLIGEIRAFDHLLAFRFG